MSTLIRHFGFMCKYFFFSNCSVGCVSMAVWTPAVLGVL